MGTLKPQSNGPLYNNTVIGTLHGCWWVGCCIWYSDEGTLLRPRPVPFSLYQM